MTVLTMTTKQLAEAIKELGVFKTPVSVEHGVFSGNFNIKVYDVDATMENSKLQFEIITINEVHNGDQLFLAQVYKYEGGSYAIIDNEQSSMFDVIAKADAAMNKFMNPVLVPEKVTSSILY
ncbi:hypothetical protein [Lysinibacillus xylanilyticus]|uniref:Uncharacterized protein n=1 Tax=Lysinibacillus xylanilyticus TaxID=582475 RepID=A0ABT4EUS9_9BACI|nr:hypothetical protein [Lysinibacillus xylanilyticus]MCY9549401.1 hypothetical protein [Lysinibacillus xylanilyticus]